MRAHKALLRDDRLILLGPWLSQAHAQLRAGRDQPRQGRHGPPRHAHGARRADRRRRPSPGPRAPGQHRSMLEGIATLPEEQRHALLRREVDGASHADIASELGISGAGVARARPSRAHQPRQARRRLSMPSAARCSTSCCAPTGPVAAPSAHVYRHLAVCKRCRGYRGQLRAMRGALHALHPGGLLFLSAAAAKLGLRRRRGALAARCGEVAGRHRRRRGAVGRRGRRRHARHRAGQPSPATIHCARPAGRRASRRARRCRRARRSSSGRPTCRMASKTVTLSCPSGPPCRRPAPAGRRRRDRRLREGDAPRRFAERDDRPVRRSQSRRRRGRALPHPRPRRSVDVEPQRERPRRRRCACAATRRCVCGAHYLRSSPAGGVTGSIGSGEPLRVLQRTRGWRRMTTEFGATGWVPARDLCG